MIDYYETKTHPVTKRMVLEAYRKVKQNKGSAGIDEQSIQDFDKNLQKNLYKLWNRMSSGSYFPSPVKEVKIPKKSGGTRSLGIPTVADRVAQQVVKYFLEPKIDHLFHPDSYGYRRDKNAHQAIHTATQRCFKAAWVIDMDIKGFYDNIDHELMMKAVRFYTQERWIILYVERWLKAGIMKEGLLQERDKGTPQGGVVSPLLANIFLHIAFDKWMQKTQPHVQFERYCDDIIVHCKSEQQTMFIKTRINERMKECKMELHESKTKIVYCQNVWNRVKQTNSSFDFLGYTFRPRVCHTKPNPLLLFVPCMSESSMKSVRTKVKDFGLTKFKGKVQALSQKLNPQIRGWMAYYCKFTKWATLKLWRWLNLKLYRWVMKNKGYNKLKAIKWMKSVYQTQPNLFAHWQLCRP
ncbi:group II intron reverse transcriptase/maturase [Arcticibacter eurypsychrophilus]|uniref:group II intron reverse transcriptase/maturase n=1 Tax=Arcticibacter eurypsychrophilus TaxID=1434752 RepID=UPI00084DC450|nr:group II intron reverse transcriptase/maturase [Arcticibacter eurypsychrophilus]